MIIHLVTDRRRLTPGADATVMRDRLLAQAGSAIAAGVDVIQIREHDLEAGALLALSTEVVRRSRGTRTRVVINDRLDVALAAGADGVHLPARSLPVAAVRRVVGPGVLIGRSVHDIADLEAVTGADYVIAGTVWPTSSKAADHKTLEAHGLATLVANCRVPVLAIGGVTVARADELAATGAAGVAAIGLFLTDHASDGGAQALEHIVTQLRHAFATRGSG